MKITAEGMQNAKAAAEALERAGFKKAAENMRLTARSSHGLQVAYDSYPYFTQADIDAFNKALREKTEKKDGRSTKYDVLVFLPIDVYAGTPPPEVLTAVEHAQSLEIFDRFEVAKIDTKRVDPDPIVFGRINDCADRFLVAEWGDDVKAADIMACAVRAPRKGIMSKMEGLFGKLAGKKE